MFGLSADRRPYGEARHYLSDLESYLQKLGRSAAGRDKAQSLSEAFADRLRTLASAVQGRTPLTGDDLSPYATRAAASGRDGIAVLAREVTANPVGAVVAALGVGFIVGIVLRRRSGAPRPTPIRRVRKGTRK